MTVELYSGHKADLIFIFPGHDMTALITLNILQHIFTEIRAPAIETCTQIRNSDVSDISQQRPRSSLDTQERT